jgi:hypothetical protein
VREVRGAALASIRLYRLSSRGSIMHPGGLRTSAILGRPDHGEESSMDVLHHAPVRAADLADDQDIVGRQGSARNY